MKKTVENLKRIISKVLIKIKGSFERKSSQGTQNARGDFPSSDLK